MVALNHYRLRHKVREGHRGARKTSRLLRRKDRLLGTILIGTNLVNNSLAIVAGMICYRWFGEIGYSIAAVGLTLLMLIFFLLEVAPKRIGVARPESIAFPASYVIDPLHKVFHPVRTRRQLYGQLACQPIRRENHRRWHGTHFRRAAPSCIRKRRYARP